jgi:hypothetical protein
MLSFKELVEFHDASEEEYMDMVEALNAAQRMAMSRAFKRNKHRVAIGRKKAERKTADRATIEKRAQKQARLAMLKKLTKGSDKSELSFAQRQAIEKRMDKMQAKIKMMAKRMIPKVRKDERERKQRKSN